jgi:hypothetical protein
VRRGKVARYVARGYTYDEIGDLVGVSSDQAYRDYKAWQGKRIKRLASRQDAAFLEVLNGLDETVRRAWDEIAEEGTTPRVRRELLEVISKTLERKARLMGLMPETRGPGSQVTTNILALVHPQVAGVLSSMTEGEAEVIEAEVLALPGPDDEPDDDGDDDGDA